MKWFIHPANSRQEEDVARLVDGGGMEALARYGAFVAIQEIIADRMSRSDPTCCSATYSLSTWANLLNIRGSHVVGLLEKLAASGVVTVERLGNDSGVTGEGQRSEIKVTCSKLLKRKDEYSQKSGQTPETIQRESKDKSRTDSTDSAKSSGQEKKNQPAPATPPRQSPPDRNFVPEGNSLSDDRKWARSFVPGVHEFYLKVLKLEEKDYGLTPTRLEKAVSRTIERLKAHNGDRAAVRRDMMTAIQNICADPWRRSHGQCDWSEHLFRSRERFEKWLNINPTEINGGHNGNGNHIAGSATHAGRAVASTLAGAAANLQFYANNTADSRAGCDSSQCLPADGDPADGTAGLGSEPGALLAE